MNKSNANPILFSTPMVRAILDGRKTQTRRIVKKFVGSIEMNNEPIDMATGKNVIGYAIDEEGNCIKCPYGFVGNILWIRETWRAIEQDFGEPRYEYKATETINLTDKWKPSIFMPYAACRIFLQITDIKIERLNDITESDAKSEGVQIKSFPEETYTGNFVDLWNSINGNWKENPFVWVITFKPYQIPFVKIH